MAGGYTDVPHRALAAAGAAVLLCSAGVLSACSSSSADKTAPARATASSTKMDPAAVKAAAVKAAADKAATAKAAAEQSAAVKAAGDKYAASQKSRELASTKSHSITKAAAACGVPVAYVYAGPTGSRIRNPEVPKDGDMWRVKATSPVSPGMIIYWPDGGKVLCR